jgi:uncharacterized protein (DUF1697 family)
MEKPAAYRRVPLAIDMKTYVALFRGINVGGNNRLPMKHLTLLLEKHACADVRTYIQSGNVVFRSTASNTSRLATQLTAAVSRSHGFAPHVIVLTAGELASAAAGNPYHEAHDNPASVHLFFLAERPPKPDLKSLEALKAAGERFALKGRTFYLHTPDGFGRSKLASRAERLLGVEATARNWRTVTTLLEMARGAG